MAASRENVLAAIVEFVENNKRRAPAAAIAVTVGDTVPNVQAIIKELIAAGSINSSRGRNGGALPDGVILEKKPKAAKPKVEAASSEPAGEDTASQFAALLAKMEAEEAASTVAEEVAAPFWGGTSLASPARCPQGQRVFYCLHRIFAAQTIGEWHRLIYSRGWWRQPAGASKKGGGMGHALPLPRLDPLASGAVPDYCSGVPQRRNLCPSVSRTAIRN